MKTLIVTAITTLFLSNAFANSAPKFDIKKYNENDRQEMCCKWVKEQVKGIKDTKSRGTAMKEPLQQCAIANKFSTGYAFSGKCKP